MARSGVCKTCTRVIDASVATMELMHVKGVGGPHARHVWYGHQDRYKGGKGFGCVIQRKAR